MQQMDRNEKRTGFKSKTSSLVVQFNQRRTSFCYDVINFVKCIVHKHLNSDT